jgi:hypothetical protein
VRAFVFGLGGGGDVVSAYVASLYLQTRGYETVLGAVTWERYVEDPLPGPICEFENSLKINDSIIEVNKSSFARRANRLVVPQLVRLLNAVGLEKGYAICIKYGVKKVAYDIDRLAEEKRINLIVGVDAGGDVLAKGCEETLGSPLIDFFMLNVLVNLKTPSLLVTIGAGSDGELPHDYIIRRIAEIAKNGGLKDIKGFDEEIARKVEKVFEYVNTEASRIPYEAFKGLYGEISIRGGLRKVFVTPVSAIMFFLDPKVVADTSPIAKVVDSAESLEDANKRLNEVGIYTEYNFELDLYSKFGENASKVNLSEIMKVREEGRRRLGNIKMSCS